MFVLKFNVVCCLSFQLRIEWSTPARPNGDIVSYTVYQRDPVQLSTTSTVFTPEDGDFSERHSTLSGLAPYHRSVKADFHYGQHLCFYDAVYGCNVRYMYK